MGLQRVRRELPTSATSWCSTPKIHRINWANNPIASRPRAALAPGRAGEGGHPSCPHSCVVRGLCLPSKCQTEPLPLPSSAGAEGKQAPSFLLCPIIFMPFSSPFWAAGLAHAVYGGCRHVHPQECWVSLQKSFSTLFWNREKQQKAILIILYVYFLLSFPPIANPTSTQPHDPS